MSLLGGDFPFEYLLNEIVSSMFAAEGQNDDAATYDYLNTMKKPNAATKLEHMGFRVGYALIERMTKECPRFASELDAMKFLCKEFWLCVFRKQVDNLKTNHQGVYVVQDNKFALLQSLSNSTQHMDIASRYLAFPCGIIRGALTNLHIPCIVTASVDVLPVVRFSIQVQQRS